MPEKKWVLITGAASGIGRSTALLLAEKGFGVYAMDLPSEELDDLHRTSHVEAIRIDITSYSDIGEGPAHS